MKKYFFTTIALCLFFVGISHSQQADRYTIKNLDSVNTKYSDFGVAYYGSDQVVFASSRKVRSIRNRIWKPNSQPYLELYKASIGEEGEIVNEDLFSKNINTRYHEADVTFTKDLKTVYFTRNNYINRKLRKDSEGITNLKLYRSSINDDGDWGEPEELRFNSDTYSVGHPTLNKAEDVLYFISDMPGSLGKTDIFYITLNEDGSYGDPMNLGPTVNTIGREMFPYISQSNDLYFSTDGRSGAGALDVFVTKVLNNNSGYEVPENLGSPINSPKDDFAFVIDEQKSTGYLSSNREGGKGDDDIYYFEELEPLERGCRQMLVGIVREKKSGALLPGAIVSLIQKGEDVKKVIANHAGAFYFDIECESNYKVLALKDGYTEDSKLVDSDNENNKEQHVELELDDTAIIATTDGRELININPIYFDLDKSFIRPDASIELEKVIAVMNRYPNMVVQLGSHTDSRASDAYNWSLSNRRAASSLNYIVSKGVDRSRIFGSGYGETQLVNQCANGVRCSEEEHQLNRRTEFVILRYE